MRELTKYLFEYPEDWYSFLVVVMAFALAVLPFFIEVHSYALMPWLFLSGLINFIANLVNHNHTHVPTFRKDHLNKAFNVLLTVARMAPVTFIVIIHNINHHGSVLRKEDWFHESNEGSGPVFLRPFVYTWNTLLRFKRMAKPYKKRLTSSQKKMLRVERYVLISYLVIIFAADWRVALVFGVLPAMFGNYCTVLTNLLHHRHANLDHPANVARNYVAPW